MFQLLAPILGAFGASAKTQAIVGGLASYVAAKQQRKQAIADQDNQYVRMRDAAQRAGFNPLTVLRNTGGQGFTGLPVISKAAAFGNMATGIFDAVRQAPIDKYNQQVRDLEIKQRQADLKIAGMTIGKMSKPIVNAISKKPSGISVFDVNKKANVTTKSGFDLPNDPQIPEGYFVPDLVMTQNPVHLGPISISASPFSPTSVVEEQYGDPVSWAYGFIKAGTDLYHTGMKTAFELGAEGFNNPKRGQMVKKRLTTGDLSKPVMEKPRFGEQWHMYAP